MKIALIGYGKMGKAIDELIQKEYSSQHEVVLRINSANRNLLATDAYLIGVDVAIEFSVPAAAPQNILSCFKAGIPVVCGTTGWINLLEEVKQQCSHYKGALVYASNFSVGVNLFFEVNRILAQYMRSQSQYLPSLEETHHVFKLDSPSGTAITLAEAIIAESRALQKWVNHPSDKPDELPIISQRLEEVKGTHVVKYDSLVDSIEIKHTAHSRYGFAQGAVMAAEWIVGKKGVFTMRDVLNL